MDERESFMTATLRKEFGGEKVKVIAMTTNREDDDQQVHWSPRSYFERSTL